MAIDLSPPPTIVELVRENPDAGRIWKKWISGLYNALQVEDWHVVGDTGEPGFQNGWANVTGEAVAAFYKDPFGRVHIKGGVDSGSSDTIFTLPAGYRPSEKLRFPVREITTPTDGKLIIDTDGTVDSTVGAINGVGINVSFRV